VLGSASQPQLQIVPTVRSFDTSGNQIYILGSGFVEGASTYSFAGVTVPDTNVNSTIDVTYDSSSNPYVNNGRVNLPEPLHGAGNLTVTTAGGTSAPLVLNTTATGVTNQAYDMAFDAVSGNVWIADASVGPNALRLVDLGTGQVVRSISLAANGSQNFGSLAGLQVVRAAGNESQRGERARRQLAAVQRRPNKDQVMALTPARVH